MKSLLKIVLVFSLASTFTVKVFASASNRTQYLLGLAADGGAVRASGAFVKIGTRIYLATAQHVLVTKPLKDVLIYVGAEVAPGEKYPIISERKITIHAKDMKVVYENTEDDLALIELPTNDIKPGIALELPPAPLQPGKDVVWAFGFSMARQGPHHHACQFKGEISVKTEVGTSLKNNEFFCDGAGFSDYDDGMSGGPLFGATEKTKNFFYGVISGSQKVNEKSVGKNLKVPTSDVMYGARIIDLQREAPLILERQGKLPSDN